MKGDKVGMDCTQGSRMSDSNNIASLRINKTSPMLSH